MQFLKNKPLIFALAFAIIGAGLILITHASTPYSNPAHNTYKVKLPPPDCIKTKSGTCSPIQGTEGLKLYGPSNKSAKYVLKNVGPGRYNLDISYSIPQVVGVYDYGYIKYGASGSLVNIGQSLSGSKHIALYGNAPATSTAPLNATETFTSLGVKWPKSDVKITIGYKNKHPTTLRVTSIILRPQKSQSGWTCTTPDAPCKPSPDYKYYFASGKAPSAKAVSSASNTSTNQSTQDSSGSSQSSSTSAQSRRRSPSKTSTNSESSKHQKTTFKENGSIQSSTSNSAAAEELDTCSQGGILSQAYCHIRSGLDSLFSHL